MRCAGQSRGCRPVPLAPSIGVSNVHACMSHLDSEVVTALVDRPDAPALTAAPACLPACLERRAGAPSTSWPDQDPDLDPRKRLHGGRERERERERERDRCTGCAHVKDCHPLGSTFHAISLQATPGTMRQSRSTSMKDDPRHGGLYKHERYLAQAAPTG